MILLRNCGPQACITAGCPGFNAVGADGVVMASAERTPRGYIGGLPVGDDRPPTLTLQPDETASALTITTKPATGEPSRRYTALLVTPPDEIEPVRLSTDRGSCTHLQIHPLVPGTDGGIGTG